MLHLLTNAPRDYAWGSHTLIAALEGRAPASAPEAEVWFGDHPGDPADLADGRTLEAITSGELPYLLKLLAADAPLSIQVHPTKAQAVDGFAREIGLAVDHPGRNYRDDNHKPELLVVLSERFEALCGLREIGQTRRLVASLNSSSDGVARLTELLAGSVDPLRAAMQWALAEASSEQINDIIGAVRDSDSTEFTTNVAAIRSIAARNPGDPGVVVALLMNYVVMKRGEAVFLRAGLLHAYVCGLGVEIMAASDNVMRGGLTAKHIDVAELMSIVDTTPGDVDVQKPDAAMNLQHYDIPVEDFALTRASLGGEPVTVEVRTPAMVLATSGEVCVTGADGTAMTVPVGSVAFADSSERSLTLSGHGEAFIAEPGITV